MILDYVTQQNYNYFNLATDVYRKNALYFSQKQFG